MEGKTKTLFKIYARFHELDFDDLWISVTCVFEDTLNIENIRHICGWGILTTDLNIKTKQELIDYIVNFSIGIIPEYKKTMTYSLIRYNRAANRLYNKIKNQQK